MGNTLIIDEEEAFKNVTIANKGIRLINFTIDYLLIIAIFIMSSSFYQFLYIQSDFLFLESLNLILIFKLFYFLYYFIFETLSNGKTPAKFITQTRAMRENGEDTRISDFIKRSLFRIIPFEAFTIFGTQLFHDSKVGMIVIKERKTHTTFYN